MTAVRCRRAGTRRPGRQAWCLAIAVAVPLAAAQTPPPTLGSAADLWSRAASGAMALPYPVYPRVPHEVRPDRWPQPDYFAEAQRLTAFKTAERFRTLRLRPQALASTDFIVLPVQTQAFAFGPEFRALVGAELDRRLRDAGLRSTAQTDIVDAFGPFVRRIDADAMRRFAAQHPSHRTVTLYLGHDGDERAFVDLAIAGARGETAVHRTVQLPRRPLPAFEAIATALPEMLREAGLPAADRTAPSVPFRCDSSVWNLTPEGDPASRACAALVVGSLLPDFDGGEPLMRRSMTEAKAAWLARAAVAASAATVAEPHARDVRDLALWQLGFAEAPHPAPIPDVRAVPVAVQLAKALGVADRIEKLPGPDRSRALRQELEALSTGLPSVAAALLRLNVAMRFRFGNFDLCELDTALFTVTLARCGESDISRARSPTPAVAALYAEWRIAKHYKDLVRQGHARGYPNWRDAFDALPGDVAEHPLLQRVRYQIEVASSEPGGGFEALRERTRRKRQAFVQSTMNLQRNDGFMAAYSLSEHPDSRNMHLEQDDAIRGLREAEERVMAVMLLDRFVPDRPTDRLRRPSGTPAYFLQPGPMPPYWREPGSEAGIPKFAVVTPYTGKMPSASAPASRRDPLFEPRTRAERGPLGARLEALVAEQPRNMNFRARLAIERLKAGTPVAKVVALFNERPADGRVEGMIAESNAWSLPAHVFFHSGELSSARPFYERVQDLRSQSESEMLARVRARLLDDRMEEALDFARRRVVRYDSDGGRRDLIGLTFLSGSSTSAWAAFYEGAASAKTLQPWLGAAVGHRMEAATLAQVRTWLPRRGLDRVQINFVDAAGEYLHLLAVTDRLPSEGDIDLLRLPPREGAGVDPRWALSALLMRAALGGIDGPQALARFEAAVEPSGSEGSHDFMLPLYVWIAAQAGGANETIDMVRGIGIESDFDRLLAKAMLLSLRPDRSESLRFLAAARYELGSLAWVDPNGLSARPIPAEFQFALGAFLLHRKTGDTRYRDVALEYARSWARASPYSAWAHSLAAAIETDPSRQKLAACRARFLDTGSYFLSQSPVSAATAKCPQPLW